MAVALTLVRLKLTLLRRSMTGSRGAWMVARAVAGTALAVSTIVLAALYRASPAILGDLLGVVYALWLAGWIALATRPADLRAGLHRLRQHGVELGVGVGGEPAFGVRAQAQADGVGLADVINPVDADQRPDPRD